MRGRIRAAPPSPSAATGASVPPSFAPTPGGAAGAAATALLCCVPRRSGTSRGGSAALLLCRPRRAGRWLLRTFRTHFAHAAMRAVKLSRARPSAHRRAAVCVPRCALFSGAAGGAAGRRAGVLAAPAAGPGGRRVTVRVLGSGGGVVPDRKRRPARLLRMPQPALAQELPAQAVRAGAGVRTGTRRPGAHVLCVAGVRHGHEPAPAALWRSHRDKQRSCRLVWWAVEGWLRLGGRERAHDAAGARGVGEAPGARMLAWWVCCCQCTRLGCMDVIRCHW